jgi:zinc/manganese transport system permease protein
MSAALAWLTEPFQYGFMQRGLLTAWLLCLSGALLGPILVLRRLSLMGDALSHSLLPGVALAYFLFGPGMGALLTGALLAGLFTAVGSAALGRLTRLKDDAAFGALFVICFAAGIALMSAMPTRLDLMHFLFGNILGVSSGDVKLAATTAALTLAAFALWRRPILLHTFDPVFHRATGGRGGWVHVGVLALVVLNLVAALQTMGIVLALGLFLLPALTAYLWCDRLAPLCALACALGTLGSLGGLLLSYHFGLASGAASVLTLGAAFLTSAVLSPHHGALARLLARPRGAIRHTAE